MAAISQDPTNFGLARSLARPDGNFTGFWLEGDDGADGQTAGIAQGCGSRDGQGRVVVNPDDLTDSAGLRLLPTTAGLLNLTSCSGGAFLAVGSSPTAAARDGVQGLLVSPSSAASTSYRSLLLRWSHCALASVSAFGNLRLPAGSCHTLRTCPTIYQRAAEDLGQDSQRNQAGRYSHRAANSVRTGCQSQDRQSSRLGYPRAVLADCRRSDRMKWRCQPLVRRRERRNRQ